MSEMNLLSIFNMVEAQDRLMTCPGECRDSLQHQKKQEKKHWKQSLHKRKSTSKDVSRVLFVPFSVWLVKYGHLSLMLHLQFNSCTVKPHLNITIHN